MTGWVPLESLAAPRRAWLGWLLLVLAGFGCRSGPSLESYATSKETKFAKEATILFIRKDTDAFARRTSPLMQKQLTAPALAKLSAEIPSGEPADPTLVGYVFVSSSGTTTTRVSLEYKFTAEYLLAHVQVEDVPGQELVISYLKIQRLPESLESLNAFRLKGKPPLQLVFLAFAGLVPLLIVVSLVVCVRTDLVGWKWLWMIFISLGVGKIGLNWTSGAITTVQPLAILLFGAGVVRTGPTVPWFLSVSLPIGALIFLIARPSLVKPPNVRPYAVRPPVRT